MYHDKRVANWFFCFLLIVSCLCFANCPDAKAKKTPANTNSDGSNTGADETSNTGDETSGGSTNAGTDEPINIDENSVINGHFLTFASSEEFTLSSSSNSKYWSGDVYYANDAQNLENDASWILWDGTSSISSLLVNKINYILVRGNNFCAGQDNFSSWKLTPKNPDTSSSTPKIYSFGDMSNLISYSNAESAVLSEGSFRFLFDSNSYLVTAPSLPFSVLKKSCYFGMFYNCTSLLEPPILPSETLADSCYMNMFNGCESLKNATALPATTLKDSCYANMFCDCTSLESIPYLPGTPLTANCYNSMFAGCKSLNITTTKSGLNTNTLKIGVNTNNVSNPLLTMFKDTLGNVDTPSAGSTYFTSNTVIR